MAIAGDAATKSLRSTANKITVFEHRTEPLLPLPAFRRRLARHVGYALWLIGGSLLGGTFGFWYFGGQAPIDALLNSAMLLGGMGPVGEIRSTTGKLFATFFALYAGLAFLGVATILFTPIFHRVLHKFHLEEQYRRGAGAGTGKQPPGKTIQATRHRERRR